MARSGRNMPRKEIKSILSEGHRKLNKINEDQYEINQDSWEFVDSRKIASCSSFAPQNFS